MLEFLEEEGLGARQGTGGGGEGAEGGGEGGEVVGGDAEEELGEGEGPGVGEGVFAAVEAAGGFRQGVGVAEDGLHADQCGKEFCFELVVVRGYYAHAAVKDREQRFFSVGEPFAGMKFPHYGVKTGYERVEQVILPAGVSGKIQYAHIFGVDVPHHGSHCRCCGNHKISFRTPRFGHEPPRKARILAVDNLHEVAFFQLYVLDVEEWNGVGVGPRENLEIPHGFFADNAVAMVGAAVEHHAESVVGQCAELFDVAEPAFYENIIECQQFVAVNHSAVNDLREAHDRCEKLHALARSVEVGNVPLQARSAAIMEVMENIPLLFLFFGLLLHRVGCCCDAQFSIWPCITYFADLYQFNRYRKA